MSKMLTQLWTGLGWGQVLPAVLLLLAFYWWWTRPRTNLPPCPTPPLPLLGHLLFLIGNPRKQFAAWRRNMGDLYTIYMGSSPLVVLNGYRVLHETLVKRGDVFSDRPTLYTDKARGVTGKGISFNSGEAWRKQRTMTMSILRRFGMGKNICEEKIQEEITFFLDHLTDLKGQPSNILFAIAKANLNITCSIAIGHRFDYNDRSLIKVVSHVQTLEKSTQWVSLLGMFPWLRFLPGDLFKAKVCFEAMQGLEEHFLRRHIQENRMEKLRDEEASNFIQAYFQEQRKREEKGEDGDDNDMHLTRILMDLVLGGTDTSTQTMNWCVLYILHHPEVQEKIVREIKQEVGLNQRPGLKDKPRLKYLNAVIMETQRLASIVPVAPHVTSDDVNYRGYTFPKGTELGINLDSIHHDPDVWGDDALSFRPDRFLDEDNKLSVPEELVIFGMGRRICLGKDLAKMELFLFLSAMFQRFQFLPEDPNNLPPLEEMFSLVISPLPYRVRCIERMG